MKGHHSEKIYRRQVDRSIAETARLLVELVRERIDAGGRVSPDLIAGIRLAGGFVCVSFCDYPDEFMPLVEWRE